MEGAPVLAYWGGTTRSLGSHPLGVATAKGNGGDNSSWAEGERGAGTQTGFEFGIGVRSQVPSQVGMAEADWSQVVASTKQQWHV